MRFTRVTISSEFTPLFKFGVPVLWILIWGFLVASLINDPDSVTWNGVPGGAPPSAVWQTTAAGIAGIVYIVWICRNLVTVQLAGPTLIVSDYSQDARVPATEIDNVTRWWWSRPGLVTVTFRSPTPFGRRISFVPQASVLEMLGLGLFDNSAVRELCKYAELHRVRGRAGEPGAGADAPRRSA
jgi:hypothetical protein